MLALATQEMAEWVEGWSKCGLLVPTRLEVNFDLQPCRIVLPVFLCIPVFVHASLSRVYYLIYVGCLCKAWAKVPICILLSK
jgi:hypothetical protein